MYDKQLLKQIGNLIDERLNPLKKSQEDMRQDLAKKIEDTKQELTDRIEDTKQELTVKIDKTKQELSKKIDDSQKDTIEVLTDIINTGYNLHEDRIKRIEDNLDLPHFSQ